MLASTDLRYAVSEALQIARQRQGGWRGGGGGCEEACHLNSSLAEEKGGKAPKAQLNLKCYLERGRGHLRLHHVLLSTFDLRISISCQQFLVLYNCYNCYDCDLVDIQSHAIFSWHMPLNWGLCRQRGLPSFDLAGPLLSPNTSIVITTSITSSISSFRDYLTIVQTRYEVKESPELIFIDGKASKHRQTTRLARKLEPK